MMYNTEYHVCGTASGHVITLPDLVEPSSISSISSLVTIVAMVITVSHKTVLYNIIVVPF